MKIDIRFRLRKSRLLSRIWNQVLSFLFLRQWVILVASDIKNDRSLWDNFIPLFPPSDRFWADPFVWFHNDKFHIFVEEYLYIENRGRISCITLDKQLKPVACCVVLERPYHLSYPFLFEYENQLYMLPETRGNHSIELYRCTNFPNEWVFTKTLMSDIFAVDSTLLKANGKWWLFTNVSNSKGNYSNALHLYYADHPLASKWTPHPQNPIVEDLKFTRPAGRIFIQDGNLIRPSQDCSTRYGYAINFSRITSLTESSYEEVYEQTIQPPKNANIFGTHTWNAAKGLHVSDALFHWPRLSIRRLQVITLNS